MANKLFDNLIEVEQKKRADDDGLVRFVAIFLLVFCLLFYARTQVYMLIDVVGDSMCPTLDSGDLLVANRKTDCKRGDIIVFSVGGEKNLIKRVIAVAGDTVWSENGMVYVSYKDGDGERYYQLSEDYLLTQGITYIEKTTVNDGCVFVLGDNRAISNDSRNFGQVKISTILGVVTKWSVAGKDTVFARLYYLL